MGLNLAAVQLVRLRARVDHPCHDHLIWNQCHSFAPSPGRPCVLYFKLTCSMALSCRTTDSTPGAHLGWRCGSKVLPCEATAFQCRPVSSQWLSKCHRWLALFKMHCCIPGSQHRCMSGGVGSVGACVLGNLRCCSLESVVFWLWRCSCLSILSFRTGCSLNILNHEGADGRVLCLHRLSCRDTSINA